MTKDQMRQVLAALDSSRVMARDEHGHYTREVTPKVIADAIKIMQSAVDAPEVEPVAYRFTQNRGNGNTEFTYHDHTEQNNWRTAYKDNCLEITPLFAAPNESAKEEPLQRSYIERLIDILIREAETDGCKDRAMSDATHEVKTLLLGTIESHFCLLRRVIDQRNAMLSRGYDDFMQVITDPENQPSQFGTVTLSMYQALEAERDALQAALDVPEVETVANDVACDTAYRNGLHAGWGFGCNDDFAGYQKSMESYRIQIAKAPQERKPFDLLVITTAYEQGVGKGIKRDNFNPYLKGTDAHDAWVLGYEEGLTKEAPTKDTP